MYSILWLLQGTRGIKHSKHTTPEAGLHFGKVHVAGARGKNLGRLKVFDFKGSQEFPITWNLFGTR